MDVAYIVLAHHRPDLLGRLLQRLEGDIYVHLDARADLDAFRSHLAGAQLINRRTTRWGGPELVLATVDALHAASDRGFDYAVLLSGQDYPIKPAAAVNARLAEQLQATYLNHFALPSPNLGPSGGVERYESRWVRLGRRTVRLSWPRRRMVNGWTPYAGSQFWCLPSHAADVLLSTFGRRKVRRFFSTTRIADEVAIPTILMNSPAAPSVVNDSLHLTPFSSGLPRVFDAVDIGELRTSDALWARKFASTDALDVIDERLLGTAT